MENFKKWTSGVYCLASQNDTYKHGDQTTVTTKYGKEVDVTIWKRLGVSRSTDETLYSYIRNDGFNRKEWQKRKLERAQNKQARLHEKSEMYYEKSNKDRAFLSLGEPVKVGHHSERRHRKIIREANENTAKSIEATEKAHAARLTADTLERRIKHEINIDTPDCVEQLMQRIVDIQTLVAKAKADDEPAFVTKNLNANRRRYEKRLEKAMKLWTIEEGETNEK